MSANGRGSTRRKRPHSSSGTGDSQPAKKTSPSRTSAIVVPLSARTPADATSPDTAATTGLGPYSTRSTAKALVQRLKRFGGVPFGAPSASSLKKGAKKRLFQTPKQSPLKVGSGSKKFKEKGEVPASMAEVFRTVFVAGQIGVTEWNRTQDLELSTQTIEAVKNVREVIKSYNKDKDDGLDLKDIIDTTILVKEWSHGQGVIDALYRFFEDQKQLVDKELPTTCTIICVPELPTGAKVELKCTFTYR
jgi:enamine deaminase RidA (YjgF/YER057c/UK114 family)